MNKSQKNRYVYCVFCNTAPILYAIHSNKESAIEYAKFLINHRFSRAMERNYEFGYYHYVEDNIVKTKETKWDKLEKLILSACLKIKDNLHKGASEDGCFVKVERRRIIS